MQFQSRQARASFEKYVLAVAAATLEKGGAVSRLDNYQFLAPVDDWQFPKYPGKTAILAPEVNLAEELKNFILLNEPYLNEADCWLGTWINPQTQHIYLDITTRQHDLDEARKMALAYSLRDGRKIVALYNSMRNVTHYL
jgi:hypothetical protein